MPVAVMAESSVSFRRLLEQCETQELEAPGGIATPLVYGQLLALYLLHNDMNNARYLWKRIPPAIKSANAELGAVWSVGQRIWQRDFPGIYTAISAHQWSETIQPIMEALRDATRRRAFGLVSQAYTSIVADDFAAFVGLPVEEAVKGVLEQGWQADFATRMVVPKKPGVLEASFNRFIPSSVPEIPELPTSTAELLCVLLLCSPTRSVCLESSGWQLARQGAARELQALFSQGRILSALMTQTAACTEKLWRLLTSGTCCSSSCEPAPVPPIPNEQQLARLTDYVAFLEN